MPGWRFYNLAGQFWRNGILMSPDNKPSVATFYTPEWAREEAQSRSRAKRLEPPNSDGHPGGIAHD